MPGKVLISYFVFSSGGLMTLATIEKYLAGPTRDKISVCMATGYEAGNYGDLLSRYIVEKLSGKEVVKYPEDNTYHLCSVGSVLSRNKMCAKTVVWGSGFLSPQAQYKIILTKIRQHFRGKVGNACYLAVRGAKTREILLKAGYKCPAVFADPALLMPKFYFPQLSKKFRLGVVLHWSQEKFASMFSAVEGVKIIDINRPYNDLNSFVDEILQCDYILSSSLHGLIIADAYKVPCVRLKIDKNPIAASEAKDDFKFEDYLSGLNICKEDKHSPDHTFNTLHLQPGATQNEELVNAVKKAAAQRNFDVNLTALVQAFPFLKEEYKGKTFIV